MDVILKVNVLFDKPLIHKLELHKVQKQLKLYWDVSSRVIFQLHIKQQGSIKPQIELEVEQKRKENQYRKLTILSMPLTR